MAFLKFILFLFIAALVLLLVIAFSFYNTLRKASRRFQREQTKRQTEVNGNVIYDNRTPQQAQQQIIPDDEGEYVEYEEE
jgi:CHASE3 domain sensor protein